MSAVLFNESSYIQNCFLCLQNRHSTVISTRKCRTNTRKAENSFLKNVQKQGKFVFYFSNWWLKWKKVLLVCEVSERSEGKKRSINLWIHLTQCACAMLVLYDSTWINWGFRCVFAVATETLLFAKLLQSSSVIMLTNEQQQTLHLGILFPINSNWFINFITVGS